MKVYSHNRLTYEEERLEVVDTFIEEDKTYFENPRIIRSLKRALSKLSEQRKMSKIKIDSFLNSIESDSTKTLDQLLQAYHTAELRDVINYPDVHYHYYEFLLEDHNKYILKTRMQSSLRQHVDSLNSHHFYSHIGAYLVQHRSSSDSMSLIIGFGLKDQFKEMTLEMNGEHYELDSLPYQLGENKGEVKLSFLHQSTNKRKWYKNEF